MHGLMVALWLGEKYTEELRLSKIGGYPFKGRHSHRTKDKMILGTLRKIAWDLVAGGNTRLVAVSGHRYAQVVELERGQGESCDGEVVIPDYLGLTGKMCLQHAGTA